MKDIMRNELGAPKIVDWSNSMWASWLKQISRDEHRTGSSRLRL